MAEFGYFLNFTENQQLFKCQKCRKTTPLVAEDVRIFACDCGSIHSKKDYDRYIEVLNNFKYDGLLSIGNQAILDGATWTVIGIANKFNPNNTFDRWIEYVMFNKQSKEFSFLNESYGNYTWFFPCSVIGEFPSTKEKPKVLHFEGKTYDEYQQYGYLTRSVIGQFPYNSVNTKNFKCYDYICPPNALSIEHNTETDEISYFKGRHFSRKEVSKLFDNERIRYQNKEGIGMAQEFYFNINVTWFTRIGIAFIVLMAVLNFGVFNDMRTTKSLTQMEFTSSYNNRANEVFVSESFVLKPEALNHYLNIHGYVSLSNEWFELAITLVNEKTGEERELGMVFEHYSGSDWEEGSNTNDVGVSELKPGRYHLKIVAYSDCISDKIISLQVKEGTPSNWNFFLINSIGLIIIIVLHILNNQFERMRSGDIDTLFG